MFHSVSLLTQALLVRGSSAVPSVLFVFITRENSSLALLAHLTRKMVPITGQASSFPLKTIFFAKLNPNRMQIKSNHFLLFFLPLSSGTTCQPKLCGSPWPT